ncbi:MAG: tripartite tricarboxylate transporter substrate binding protein [Bacteroidales bacterium]|nr:tripartite tricarboxylate transporter substrate binding protein [Fournierella massiliensis]MCF2557826.1 tripartite tricarboxylate transporter substrate binding protein [Fournierella massiliensis]MCI6739569.1 tripartite tricarboxylate transporter substrate binding protein [Bacteroidales bacterium]
MYKKVSALALAAVMTLSLVGCGSSASSSSAAASQPASSAPASSASSEAASTPATGEKAPRPEGFPSKDITYIYPFGAGSGNDVYFRLLAEKVRQMEGWDKTFVVEYMEGASGDVGWTAIANAEPDGYTIGFCPTAMLIAGVAMDRPYGTEGIDYVSTMMKDPGVIGVAANSKYNTLEELIEAAKVAPGSISVGVTSVTTSEGLALKQLQKAAGCEFNIIPFDGESAVLTAVSGGHCDSFCLNVSDGKTFVDEGSIKYLATGDEERSVFYPDLPTYQEAGYDVVQVNLRAIGAPEGTDPAILQYLSDCFVAAANDPEVIAKAEEMQLPVMTLGTEEATAEFTAIEQSYKDLWATEPWQ